MNMRNVRLDLSYDGTRYRGWQRLKEGDATIQGKLEKTLSRILDEPIEISGSGRTDAGVHAEHQIANFHCESSMSCDRILTELRRFLPEDIGVYSCTDASPRFHARLNAKQKTYRYRIWNSSSPCVFERKYVSCVPEKLDVSEMRKAGQLLVGEHDFSAFCTKSKGKKTTFREVYAAEIIANGNEISIRITADGFLYNMMRIIVGTLIEVGRGERKAESIPNLFSAERSEAGFLAPAQGLCLMEVKY